MHNRNFITRLLNYYKKRGFIRTFLRICEQPYRIIFKSKMFLFYVDMNELDVSVLNLPQDIIVECKRSYDEARQLDMQRLIIYWEKEEEWDKARERFEKGAILWILKLEGDIAAFGWSIRGKMVSPWYLPLTLNDAVLFNFVTFEEYRGRNLYSVLLNYIFGRLKSEGVSRSYGFVWEWNTQSIRGIQKAHFRKFVEARKIHFLGRNITIWS